MTSSSTKVNVSFAIVFLISVLAVRLWASHRSDEIIGPMMMRTGPDATIYIPCDNQLYIYSQGGDLIDVQPLGRFGIGRYVDDFWVYSNKDLLLRKELAQKSFLARIIESLKKPGPRMLDSMVANESAMQRCSMADFECKRLEHGSDILETLGFFRLFADENKNSLYVSDNLGHQLLLLDLQGKLARKSDKQFEFPNQIAPGNDGLLYIAENHRIVGVSMDYTTFGKIEREFKVAGKFGKIYLSALAQAPSGDWWVVASGMSMQKGDLLTYTKEGRFIKSISLPNGADPFSLVALEDRILVSDPTLMRIYSINYDGALQKDFGSDSLFLHLSYLKSQKKLYSSLSFIALWVLIAGLALTLIIFRSLLKPRTEPAGFEQNDIPMLEPLSRKYDYAQVLSLFKILAAVQLFLVALLLVFMYLMPPPKSKDALRPVMMIITGLMPLALYTVYYLLKNSSIEITEQGITYIIGRKKIYSHWQDVKKVRLFGRQYRIHTQHGTIPVGMVSPVGMVAERSFLSLGKDRAKYLEELIGEVRRRAPHAKWN